jgi:hypothetical protein
VSAIDPVPPHHAPDVHDYHGHDTRRLANDHVWIDVLARAGPRIVRLGLAGSTVNVLAETPGDGWDTPHGRYELYGGHRLWFAPEDPDLVAVPDGHGLLVEREVDGIRLTGLAEAPTGLIRSMALRLEPGRAAFEVCHALRNVGDRPIELAPWSITQLPLGGTVFLPGRLGCNVEVYVGSRYLELELLGPLGVLAPGSTVTLVEHWEIGTVEPPVDAASVRTMAERIGPTRSGAGATGRWLPA